MQTHTDKELSKFVPGPHYCERCEQQLDPSQIKWLELNASTGKFSDPEKEPVPDGESQGCFSFGSRCAKQQLFDDT